MFRSLAQSSMLLGLLSQAIALVLLNQLPAFAETVCSPLKGLNSTKCNSQASCHYAHESLIAAKPEQGASLRINRPTPIQFQFQFQSMLPGVATRWWRKFRNPSFCPFVLCASSCADISGKPKIGAYSLEQLLSDTTPCSLSFESCDSCDGGGCCMNSSLSQATKMDLSVTEKTSQE